MPTLGEFVDHSKQYGFTRRLVTFESRDADHFAELPDLRQSDRLTRDVVETLCRQLGIPPEDFGL
jgi:hypothetical protein